jgi:hypothetical protein
MKSKEEIEQLADEYSEIGKGSGLTFKEHTLENIAFINGYTQCQEDMADKKYNLEDIKKAFLNGCVSERRFTRRSSELESYINSLNKQD